MLKRLLMIASVAGPIWLSAGVAAAEDPAADCASAMSQYDMNE